MDPLPKPERANSKRGVPIRLAQVIYALELGGSEMLAWQIAKALNLAGRHACSIYAVHGSGALVEVLAADGIAAKAFFRTGKLDIGLICQLAKECRAKKVEVVHTHHLGQLIYGGLAGRLAGARVVHTEHEHYSLSPLRFRRLLRVLSVVADAVTGVAEPVTEFLRTEVRIPPYKLSTISNGVDVARFGTAKPVNRASLGWTDGDVVIGCVARLEHEKGHGILLDAFKQVHALNPNAKLLLIGDGSERRRLEQLSLQFSLNGSVLFVGTRTDVPELLATCDIIVLASIYEGLPISILEAMAAGKPVVATRVGSISQVVLDGHTGLLVQPCDANSLAEAMGSLTKDSTKRRQLGSNGLDLVSNRYNFNHAVAQYTAIYDSVLAGRVP